MVSKISGIYAYYDKKRNKFVYVGKDSNINKKARHNSHMAKSRYNAQPLNQILQNNPDRYIYQVLVWGVPDEDTLNALEIMYIKNYGTYENGFNFTLGGDGSTGWNPSEETRKKISKNHADVSGKKHPMYGRTGEKSPMYGKRGKETPNFNPCIKIRKQKDKRFTQGFRWRAQASTPEKQIDIRRVDLQECIELVEEFINSEKNVYCYESYEVVNE